MDSLVRTICGRGRVESGADPRPAAPL